MNINNFANNLNFKKIALIFVAIIAANWITHEIIMWSYFNKFQQTMNRFNDQFIQDQERIHNKIVQSEQDIDKWNKAFDQKQNEFHAEVDKGMQENLNFIQNSQKQMAEQQNAFDKKFNEMPEKMWNAHNSFAESAFAAAEANTNRITQLQAKQLRNEVTREKIRKYVDKRKIDSDARKNWEAARIRYHEINGVWLPEYDVAFKNNK